MKIKIFEYSANHGFGRLIPTKLFLKLRYYETFHRRLNLRDPRTFNEKLQWLKLYDRNTIYTTMVDKYNAKKYVADIIGEEYIIPTLGVWEKFTDIDFDSLPNQFVLKCTHDSGGLIICKDKATLDISSARNKIERSLKKNYFWHGREWAYKNVNPHIIAEQYMENDSGNGLIDFKFYCFNGVPKFLYVSKGLDNHATASISFVNLDWSFSPYERSDYKSINELPQKPSCFEEMIEISKKLSAGIPFLRVDLYQINNHVYFSELTFSPGSGFMPFKNPKHDIEIGNMLQLNADKNNK